MGINKRIRGDCCLCFHPAQTSQTNNGASIGDYSQVRNSSEACCLLCQSVRHELSFGDPHETVNRKNKS
jgi:hypothetical protein